VRAVSRAEQHRGKLLGRTLDQAVLAEPEQPGDFVGDPRIVAGEADLSRLSCGCGVQPERQVEPDRLLLAPLTPANAHDAREL
jgi:hypothetical protein